MTQGSSATNPTPDRYRGQWGGKIENGEEMWWSEPHHRLFFKNPVRNWFGRVRFAADVRHWFLLRYVKILLTSRSGPGLPQVVDFGCGTGGVTISFSKYLSIPITGYDIFATQIEIAGEMAKKWQSPCTFSKLTSQGNFPLPDQSLDVIISGDVLGHVPDIPTTLKEWARVLKPGGGVSLFTEANYSAGDTSLCARLAKQGMDMVEAVPEHISIFPKEILEKMFHDAGFEIVDRRSANVLHWWFFPKDYVKLLQKFNKKGVLYFASVAWNQVTKLLPFYPMPLELVRLGLTRILGRNGFGTSYFYLLKKK